MKKLTNQISIKKPLSVLITGYDARICENIIQLENGQYQYDMTIYTKAEYRNIQEQLNNDKDIKISELENKNSELQETVNGQQITINSLVDTVLEISMNITI